MSVSDRKVLDQLPPMPTPDRDAMRWESVVGSAIVLGISLLLVLTTHAGALHYGTIEGGWWWFFLVAIYLEAFLAVCCLLGILYGDPGVVKRSPENCLPLPEVVAERLQRGESLEGLENLQHEQLGSYCVRCCVWRRSSGKLESACLPADCDMRVCEGGPHHCRTCGRCVNHFDHHCGLFGRCIAGQGCSGNIHYFYAVIAIGWLGFVTTVAAVLLSGWRLLDASGATIFHKFQGHELS